MNNIIDLFEKRKQVMNNNLSTSMAIDLLDDVIKDLQTFENMEEIQEAIKFLRYTKVELAGNKTDPAS